MRVKATIPSSRGPSVDQGVSDLGLDGRLGEGEMLRAGGPLVRGEGGRREFVEGLVASEGREEVPSAPSEDGFQEEADGLVLTWLRLRTHPAPAVLARDRLKGRPFRFDAPRVTL